jgi:hypothetical protein
MSDCVITIIPYYRPTLFYQKWLQLKQQLAERQIVCLAKKYLTESKRNNQYDATKSTPAH